MKTREEKRLNVQRLRAQRDARTPEQQLRKLEAQGHGHCREAERLRSLIHSQNGNGKSAA